MVRDIGGYAAERDSLERTEAARAHDDKMALLLCCHRDRDLAGIALLDARMRTYAARDLVHQLREEAICRDLQLRRQITAHAHLLEYGDMRVVVDHHEDGQFGICRSR